MNIQITSSSYKRSVPIDVTQDDIARALGKTMPIYMRAHQDRYAKRALSGTAGWAFIYWLLTFVVFMPVGLAISHDIRGAFAVVLWRAAFRLPHLIRYIADNL